VIPLCDNVPSERPPIVTGSLVAVNLGVFALELLLGDGIGPFIRQAAVVPALYTGADGRLDGRDIIAALLAGELLLRVLLSSFLHGGILHILGNMVALWIFGKSVEDRLGHLRYLVFYLLYGWGAMLAHVWAEPRSELPCVGASGALAGVLGAYVWLYPAARIRVLLPNGVTQFPALALLGGWFLLQSFSGLRSLGAPAAGGAPAWWAHVGGFALGVVSVLPLARQRSRVRRLAPRFRS
jgi:membrane associated rhomboid family serine protease